jgi:hypothetical protein
MERLPLATMQPAPCQRLSLAKVFKVFGMEPAAWEVFKGFSWRKPYQAASSNPAGGHGARGRLSDRLWMSSLFSKQSLKKIKKFIRFKKILPLFLKKA